MNLEQNRLHQLQISHDFLLQALSPLQSDLKKSLFWNLAKITSPSSTQSSEALVSAKVSSFAKLAEICTLSELPDFHSQPQPNAYMGDGRLISNASPSYLKLSDAYITSRGYVYCRGHLLVEDIQYTHPNWSAGEGSSRFFQLCELSSYNPKTKELLLHANNTKLDHAVFVFNYQNAAVNFGHMVHDFLLQKYAFDLLARDNPELKGYFPPGFRYPFQEYLFNLLFQDYISSNRILRVAAPGWYSSVYILNPQFPVFVPNVGFESIDYLKQCIKTLNNTSKPNKAFERIYVSRSDGTSNAYGRANGDSPELVKVFQDYGFKVVTLGSLEASQVIPTFENAKIVAGMHGAGLLNLIFSKNSGLKLIELRPGIKPWDSIERFARAWGCNHYSLDINSDNQSMSLQLIEELRDLIAGACEVS